VGFSINGLHEMTSIGIAGSSFFQRIGGFPKSVQEHIRGNHHHHQRPQGVGHGPFQTLRLEIPPWPVLPGPWNTTAKRWDFQSMDFMKWHQLGLPVLRSSKGLAAFLSIDWKSHLFAVVSTYAATIIIINVPKALATGHFKLRSSKGLAAFLSRFKSSSMINKQIPTLVVQTIW
jgi:hypothetical protein